MAVVDLPFDKETQPSLYALISTRSLKPVIVAGSPAHQRRREAADLLLSMFDGARDLMVLGI
jgi:hypothetical protein